MPTSITLTIPTTNVDGSAITSGELTEVDIGFASTSQASAAPNQVYTLIAADTAFAGQTANGVTTIPWSSLAESLAVGTWYAAARVKTSGGQVSAWSNEASFTIAPPVPNAPHKFFSEVTTLIQDVVTWLKGFL